MIALASPASAAFVTGNKLVPLWQAHQRIQKSEQLQSSDYQNSAVLMGYVQGVCDTYDDLPEGVTIGQLVTIVGRYLDTHPEEWHLPGSIIVRKAMTEAFVNKKPVRQSPYNP